MTCHVTVCGCWSSWCVLSPSHYGRQWSPAYFRLSEPAQPCWSNPGTTSDLFAFGACPGGQFARESLCMEKSLVSFCFALLLLNNRSLFQLIFLKVKVEAPCPSYWWNGRVAQDTTQWQAESQDSCFSFQNTEGSSMGLYTLNIVIK